ncbi:DNA cross-link repair 1A protein [Sporothrix schenckii 1099-18]|uniref:DNA cross-link repair 1A protein n=1 Tax=Sporothrix schenckii 1099-18 TaxID=1397361 RepID=A0A0F2LVX1_SPOSC|nr:DNA cross-link repair 1A protein [Sporothrix schenckii 1099-18]KJR81622.1 DNA cross-link repair 1A protein [Sporothrix schenckii 1099-18]
MPTPSRTRVAARPGAVQKSKQQTMTSMAAKASTTTPSSNRLGSSPASARNKMAAPAVKGPPNKSILSFFKKVPPPEESMFVAGSVDAVWKQLAASQGNEENEVVVEAEDEVGMVHDTGDRFNECTGSVKRRRLSEEQPTSTPTPTARATQRGPFVDESDSDSDAEGGSHSQKRGSLRPPAAQNDEAITLSPRRLETHTSFDETFLKIDMKTTDTAENTDADNVVNIDDFNDLDDTDFAGFADLDDDDDAFALAGEEFRERKYMEAQARLEADAEAGVLANDNHPRDEAADGCPICGTSLAGKTSDQATVHVNACLDGLTSGTANTPQEAPHPPPPPTKNTAATQHTTSEPRASTALSGFSKRFMRTAQPRPGQANPIAFGGSGPGGVSSSNGPGSAFAKLMSGHAEDEAWATAAAFEVASRGRPAYERTCPFYKIMPGFSICVDAFRYGAVEGCRAYFLSHFHSDHYIGLTAKWCHGPIYCSQVTASLVRSQLGTAAQYVVALDFEATVPVPGIDGVRVTMIPANHCPGSAMFLFEKTMQPTGRIHRILHCGDFRACRAHVDHPLLAADTLDALTKKKKQQRIDVCYLDTTYLNPRYSFPPQDDVVAACAALCATLDQSLRAGDEGAWNTALRRRATGGGDGSGSVKDFFKRANSSGGPGDAAVPEAVTPQQPVSPPRDALAVLGRRATDRDRNRLLVVCGTYSIGKERICKAIAQALGSKIYASPAKIKVVAQLGDPELTALMTSDATEAQVHMQMLMELRAETLAEYLDGYKAHFSRIVGFRPSGWNYRPGQASGAPAPGSAAVASASGAATAAATPSAALAPSTLPTTTLLHGAGWRTRFGARDLVPQRGSTQDAICLGVPYSEHSSFRELALFLMALRIDKVVPTVNVGSDVSRKRMKAWIDRWLAERRRGGLVQTLVEGGPDGKDGQKSRLWDGKDGKGGVAYW